LCHRLRCLVLTLADTGCRIGEATHSAGRTWILATSCRLQGKRPKGSCGAFSFEQRPSSLEIQDTLQIPCDLVFPRITVCISDAATFSDVGQLCLDLHITAPARLLHSFRHSFAINYLRKGGSVFHLQRALWPRIVKMTRRYANFDDRGPPANPRKSEFVVGPLGPC